MISRYLYVQYDLGSSSTSVRSAAPLALNVWRNITITRYGPTLILGIDGMQDQSVTASGVSQGLTTSEKTYLGGLPSGVGVPGGGSVMNGELFSLHFFSFVFCWFSQVKEFV